MDTSSGRDFGHCRIHKPPPSISSIISGNFQLAWDALYSRCEKKRQSGGNKFTTLLNLVKARRKFVERSFVFQNRKFVISARNSQHTSNSLDQILINEYCSCLPENIQSYPESNAQLSSKRNNSFIGNSKLKKALNVNFENLLTELHLFFQTPYYQTFKLCPCLPSSMQYLLRPPQFNLYK